MNDQVLVIANGQTISGWQDITLTRSIESFPSAFELSFTEITPGANTVIIKPGTEIIIKIGGDTILTGYIDQYNSVVTPHAHDVRMNGRSKCEDLIDCSATFANGLSIQASYQTITEFASDLAKPFGIKVINKAEDGPVLKGIVVNLGETPYEIIEKCARWVGLLVYDDVDGNLVLDRVGSTTMAGGFRLGDNVQSASSKFQTDQRFTDYYVVWQSVDTQTTLASNLGSSNSNLHGYAEDKALKELGRYRPRYIVSSLVDSWKTNIDLGQIIADWENNRRIGRSQSVTVTTSSWRDKNGTLWQPNALVLVDIPLLKIPNLTWIIASVTFSRNTSTGTTATLVLMPPQAFSIEPISLGSGDRLLLLSLEQAASDTSKSNLARSGEPL